VTVQEDQEVLLPQHQQVTSYPRLFEENTSWVFSKDSYNINIQNKKLHTGV
jgi:hypothetical protein